MSKMMSHQKYIERVKKMYGDKYEVCSEYMGALSFIQLNCKIHGYFSKKEANALFRFGCPECGKEKHAEISKANRKESGKMYDRHKHGKASEFFVAYHLTNLGYDVVMVTGNPRYDMIIESEKGRLFVQVKSGIKKQDELKINLRGNSDTKRYTSKEIDIIAIHERSENKVLFVPINDIEGQISICLRYNPPKKIYSHRTRLINNYINFDEKWFDGIHNKMVAL